MLLLLPIASLAAASPLTNDVHAVAETATADSPGARALGVGTFLGARTKGETFDHGVRLSLLNGSTSPFAGDLRGQSRVWLSDAGSWASVAVSYGVRADKNGLGPVGDLEAAWDVPLSVPDAAYRLRIAGRLGVVGVLPDSAAVAVGVAWGPRPTPPSPPPKPAEPPPEDARIWLSHPVCAWVHLDDLDVVLADLSADEQAQVRDSVTVMLHSDEEGTADEALPPTRPQGALLVVGRLGDRLLLQGQEVAAGADGVVQLAVAEGPLEAELIGGGRRLTVRAAVSQGHGTWVRVADPAPTAIEFAVGSETLDAEALERLAALVVNAGGWSFELQGGFSPEGDRVANIALANRRSQEVQAALLELGLPHTQVQIVAAAVPEDATSASARRVCTIHPRSPGEGSP